MPYSWAEGRDNPLRLKLLAVTVLAAGLALGMSVGFRNSLLEPAVPVVFLLALIPSIHISGRLVTVVVVIVASCIFATYLFRPYGNLAVNSVVDRIELSCFGLTSMGVVLFSPRATRLAKPDLDCRLCSSFGCEQAYFESWIALMGYTIVFMAVVTLLLYIWK